MLPLKTENLSRSHSAESGQFDDQPITNVWNREALLHLFHRHDRLAGRGSVFRRHQQPGGILPDMAFFHRQREDLMQVPPEMIDGAERQAGLGLSVQEGLKLFPLDLAEFAIAQVAAD